MANGGAILSASGPSGEGGTMIGGVCGEGGAAKIGGEADAVAKLASSLVAGSGSWRGGEMLWQRSGAGPGLKRMLPVVLK